MRKSSLPFLVAGLVAGVLMLAGSASAQRGRPVIAPAGPPDYDVDQAIAARLNNLPESTDLLLHPELSARIIAPGGPLWVGLELRNVSPRDVDVQPNSRSPLVGFHFVLTRLDGVAIEPVREVQRGLRSGVISLLPGQSLMLATQLNAEFDLTVPGNYLLYAVHYGSLSAARSVPVAFSVIPGALPDARAAAAGADPNRAAAEAVAGALAANAPFTISGPDLHPMVAIGSPLDLDITITNRAKSKMRFAYENWIRLEVEHPDGRTEQVFNTRGNRDWNDLFALTYIEPQASKVFKASVADRFQFPAPGEYRLRFHFPSSTGSYEVPVTVTPEPVARAAR